MVPAEPGTLSSMALAPDPATASGGTAIDNMAPTPKILAMLTGLSTLPGHLGEC
jgi:hypothetical protein